MLVEFRIKNFRNFSNEQVFSMVASKDRSFQETHLFPTELKKEPYLLKSAAIYGANNTGKSNFIDALEYMEFSCLQNYDFAPWTNIEITFLKEGVRYQYGFENNKERVIKEYLLVYKTEKPECLFSRKFDENLDKDVYVFSSNFKGQINKEQIYVLKYFTNPARLLLNSVIQLRIECLRPILHFFQDMNIYSEKIYFPYSVRFDSEDKTYMMGNKNFINLLKALDIEFDPVNFSHTTYSRGAEMIFHLAKMILKSLSNGSVAIIDNLGQHLHPLVLKKLVRLFHDPKINKNGAQLIFTTHDTSLLNAEGLFRRDQIWFIEKNHEQVPRLYSLAEFIPCKNESVEMFYLAGRYGGIPFLDDFDLSNNNEEKT